MHGEGGRVPAGADDPAAAADHRGYSRFELAELARYVATVMHGLAARAAGGANPDEMRRAAELALTVWPG